MFHFLQRQQSSGNRVHVSWSDYLFCLMDEKLVDEKEEKSPNNQRSRPLVVRRENAALTHEA